VYFCVILKAFFSLFLNFETNQQKQNIVVDFKTCYIVQVVQIENYWFAKWS